MASRLPIEWRFWEKVKIQKGCWEWTACRSSDGYGSFSVGNTMVGAHRIAYSALVGEIPKGMMLDHTCHNKLCVNPSHLRPCTNKQNASNRLIHSNNKSGFRGVHASSGRWRASIRVAYRLIHLGYFDTPEEAHDAYRKASTIHHGEFANFGECK